MVAEPAAAAVEDIEDDDLGSGCEWALKAVRKPPRNEGRWVGMIDGPGTRG
jgi:hypothetical protein